MKVQDNSPLNGLYINENDYEYIQRKMAKYLQAKAELQGLADRWNRYEIDTYEYSSKGNALRYTMKTIRDNVGRLIDSSCGQYNRKARRVKTAFFGDDE